MTASPLFPGFDGLMTLSRREGVDIRPTLLRVLTDLYVQAAKHSPDEQRQFVELTSRLIDQVDDATRAAVRARLAIYPGAPLEILSKLGLRPAQADQPMPMAKEIPSPPLAPPPPKPLSEAERRMTSNLAMQPTDAAEVCAMFARANSGERAAILHNLAESALKASPRIPHSRATRSIAALEMAAFVTDTENFIHELSETLIVPHRIATQIVGDPGGEPLACAMRAIDMPGPTFQRVLLFLKPEIGSSVQHVYRLARLYERLSERAALVMLAAWRGSTMEIARAKYRPSLYDDERQRARVAPAERRPAVQPGSAPAVRTGTDDSSR
jgi:Uncharacterised protein conserved in bacteria (DUF2336)